MNRRVAAPQTNFAQSRYDPPFYQTCRRLGSGQCGETHALCTASVEEKVPGWMKNSGKGWVSAEYGMLPRSTHSRMDREAARGKQSGRTQEIQRLIGRALRAAVDMHKLESADQGGL